MTGSVASRPLPSQSASSSTLHRHRRRGSGRPAVVGFVAATSLAAAVCSALRPCVLRPAVHELSRCSARGFSWPSLCASRGGFPSTGGAAAVGSQTAGAISIFPVVISSSAHLSFFSIQYTFSAAVSCCRKPHLGENRGSDYMSTCACSWLIIICHCFVVMWPLISVPQLVQASCFLLVGLPLVVVRLQHAPISCLGCAVIFK